MVLSFTASLRGMALTAAFTFIALCAVSGTAHAQYKCVCRTVAIHVDATVACNVQFFAQAPTCRYAPVTVSPGSHTEIGCCDGMAISLVDVNGVSYTFSATGPRMYTGIMLANNCCVDASIKPDPNGCITLSVIRAQGNC